MKFWHVIPLLLILIGVQVTASLMAVPDPVQANTAFGNPNDMSNVAEYILMIIGITIVVLILLKYKFITPVKLLFALGVWASVFYVMANVFEVLGGSSTSDITATILLVIPIASTILILKYPEWYVIDIIGFIMCVSVTAILGVSFGIFPAIMLLILLSIYDAVSVYTTKHMVTLAEGVLTNKIPAVFIIPESTNYTYVKSAEKGWKNLDDTAARPAHILGMGDIVFPSLMVVSANTFIINSPKLLGVFTIPAVGAMIGSWVGLVVLMKFAGTYKQSHAGLPVLNAFTLAGFAIGLGVLIILSTLFEWV